MDALDSFVLPQVLADISIGKMILIALCALIIMAIITALSAFIANAPKSTFIRAFAAVITHIIFAITVILISINLNQPPSQDAIFMIIIVTAAIAYSACFVSTVVKGATVAVVACLLYFLTYEGLILLLKMYYPDIYLAVLDAMNRLLNQYQTLG